MKKFSQALLISVVMVVTMTLGTGTASARDCGKNPAYKNILVKWTSEAKCLTKPIPPFEGGGEWTILEKFLLDGASVTSAVAVDAEGSLVLEDMGTGVKIECPVTGEGSVEAEGKDLTTSLSVAAASCKVLAGSSDCKSVLAVQAVDLPWNTQLAGERDFISESGKGTPGWLVECEAVLGVKVDDTCTGTETSAAVVNLENGTLETSYDSETAAANCSVGGTGEGLILGTINVLAVSGGSLSISEE
jgi:hypothetical protein